MAKSGARNARSDEELMAAAGRRRDRTASDAFEEVARRHLQYLTRLAFQLVAPGRVDELVQDTLIRAWKYAGSYRGGRVRAWFAAIMRNQARNPSVEHPPQEVVNDSLAGVEGPDDMERIFDALQVDAALSKLDPMEAAVVRMRLLGSCSWKEIGEQTGIGSRYLVQCVYRRAISQLRRHLSEGL